MQVNLKIKEQWQQQSITLNKSLWRIQSGEYGWIDYVNIIPEWQEEYTAFCRERSLCINEESAEFVEWKEIS